MFGAGITPGPESRSAAPPTSVYRSCELSMVMSIGFWGWQTEKGVILASCTLVALHGDLMCS